MLNSATHSLGCRACDQSLHLLEVRQVKLVQGDEIFRRAREQIEAKSALMIGF